LTFDERLQVVREVAQCVSSWGYARLFAECIDKVYFNPALSRWTVGEQAFEQLVSRFEQFLANTETEDGQKNYGLLVHDNNQTVAKKHTSLMRTFHRKGTLWTQIQRLIETPLFVDSSLTSLVQIADLCGYALRRYLENGETDLFTRVFSRADRRGSVTVGVRHFSSPSCACEICKSHKSSRALVLLPAALPPQLPPQPTPMLGP
jgi:hypothetical protein